MNGLYQISNLGRVKSLGKRGNHYKERYLTPVKDKYGYHRVHLYNNGGKLKSYTIHQLVAKTFIPNPDDLTQINHKDENKMNNNVDNLEWCTIKYNNSYGSRLDTISESLGKSVMCIETKTIYRSTKEAWRQTGIDYSSIAKNCKGIRRIAGGYHWKYIDEGGDV